MDTLEHHLIHCETSRQMWNRLAGWISDNLSINYNLTECEILFGIPFTNSIDLEIINFFILFTKCFINHKKTSKSQIYFIESLGELKVKIDTMTISNILNNRQNLEWQTLLKESL